MKIIAPLHNEIEPGIQTVESASFFQIPRFDIVGLASREVAEAKERVRSSIEASGFETLRRRILLNLSPANIRKSGTGLDLPMALAVLTLDPVNPLEGQGTICAWAELGLDGAIKPVGQSARAVYSAWKAGAQTLIVATEDLQACQAAAILIRLARALPGLAPRIVGISWLSEIKKLNRPRIAPLAIALPPEPVAKMLQLPLSPHLERILGVAVAGQHHILLMGPRGSGKTRALDRLIGLLPEDTPLTRLQRLLVEELRNPFARPEDTSNAVRRVSTFVKPTALTGGFGSEGVLPGEFSLAHGGVLLADEFLEWPRDSREALREPLESGYITITRAKGACRLPAGFLLAATCNPCPCGQKLCRCPTGVQAMYDRRLSGPIRDRIDITINVENASEGATTPLSATPEKIRRFQARARELWGHLPGRMPAEQLEAMIKSTPGWEAKNPLKNADSLRSRHKTMRLALSLGLWDERDSPTDQHFYEAEIYRDRKPF